MYILCMYTYIDTWLIEQLLVAFLSTLLLLIPHTLNRTVPHPMYEQ